MLYLFGQISLWSFLPSGFLMNNKIWDVLVKPATWCFSCLFHWNIAAVSSSTNTQVHTFKVLFLSMLFHSILKCPILACLGLWSSLIGMSMEAEPSSLEKNHKKYSLNKKIIQNSATYICGSCHISYLSLNQNMWCQVNQQCPNFTPYFNRKGEFHP